MPIKHKHDELLKRFILTRVYMYLAGAMKRGHYWPSCIQVWCLAVRAISKSRLTSQRLLLSNSGCALHHQIPSQREFLALFRRTARMAGHISPVTWLWLVIVLLLLQVSPAIAFGAGNIGKPPQALNMASHVLTDQACSFHLQD